MALKIAEVDARTKQFRGECLAHINEMQAEIATKHGALVGDLSDTSNRKANVVAARAELVEALRECIVYNDPCGNVKDKPRVYALRFEVSAQEMMYVPWERVSLPDVARVIRSDHAAVLHLLRRRLREADRESKAAKAKLSAETIDNPYAAMLSDVGA